MYSIILSLLKAEAFVKLTNKKIGIWGFGVSGQSLLRYFITQNADAHIGILEKNLMPQLQAPYAHCSTVTFYKDDTTTRQQFLENHDIIIPSPGIDIRPYSHYSEKFLAEADLFYLLWQGKSSPEPHTAKKIIGITGTLGKTSITHLLSTLLPQAGISVVTGGNIGTGMFDLLSSNATYALLELSSFQLEQCKHFTADIGVITNLYPNHLDRHETMENYATAKQNIYLRQGAGQWGVIPLEHVAQLRKNPITATKPMVFFTKNPSCKEFFEYLIPGDRIYYYDKNNVLRFDQTHNSTFKQTIILENIPSISYPENWIIIAAVLDLLNLDPQTTISQSGDLAIPDYRLEKVATIKNICYYNDSKSTIMQATLAAVNTLKKNHNNIIVLLGGTSKGVDRAPFISQLKNRAHVVCFGGEAEQLYAICNQHGIPASFSKTLEQAVTFAHQKTNHITDSTAVVLSPGGASFDLFKDYKERGERFKQLVLALAH